MDEIELGAGAFWALAAAGVVAGIASLWSFRRWCDMRKLRILANRVIAHLLEIQLFSDEPALLLRAQRDLLVANGRFLKALAGPSLLLSLPFLPCLVALNAMFARAPLPVGHAAVVTLKLSESAQRGARDPELIAPPGIRVEAEPVHVLRLHEMSWRLRPTRAAAGELQILWNGQTIRKSISSRPGMQWLSDGRAGTLPAFFRYPQEWPFRHIGVAYVALPYPSAVIFGVTWIFWFSLTALAGAVVYGITNRMLTTFGYQ